MRLTWPKTRGNHGWSALLVLWEGKSQGQGNQMTRLTIALVGVALLSGPVRAQTINNAPQNSPAGVQDQVKQAPPVGTPHR